MRVASRKKNGQKELLGYPINSFEEIISTLSDRITSSGGTIHTSTTVEKIISNDNSVTGLRIRDTNGESSTRDYDKVVSTVPSYILPFLTDELPQDYINILNTTNYLSAVLLILVLEKPLSNIYWLNIADRTIPFVGIIEHTNMIDNSLYGNKHIVYITNYVTRDSEIYLSEGAELLKTFIPHLKTINPDFEDSWIVEYYHHKVDAAQPIVETNYSSQIPDHLTPINGLYLANTSQIYPEDRGTNYSVRLGNHLSAIIND